MEWIWTRLQRTPACRIYVKRMGLPGPWWKDAEYAEYAEAQAEVLQRWQELTEQANEMWASTPYRTYIHPVRRELLQYHHDQRPDERTDLIYERIESAARADGSES